MSKLQDQIKEIKDMASRIPNYNAEPIKEHLKIIPYLDESDQQETINEIKSMVQGKYLSTYLSSRNPLLEDISQDLKNNPLDLGDIFVGDTKTGRCKIKIDDLTMSSVIASPGRGKTILLYNLSEQITKYNKENSKKVSQIILDRRQDFRKIGNGVVILDLKRIPINFFDAPPNCDDTRWVSDVCNLLMSIWQFYQRSRNNLMKTILDLYDTLQRPPSLLEVYHVVSEDNSGNRRQSNRKQEVSELIEERISNTIQEFGNCVFSKKSFPLFEFLDSDIPLVIEADLSNDSFALLFGWILLYTYRYRKENNLRGNISENGTVIICDEAYLLWESARTHSDLRSDIGASFIDTAPLQLRDFRCAIVAASQRPLNQDYMATTNLKVVGYCGDYDDALYLAKSLGDPELVKDIMKLGIGKFIIKIGDSKPALLQTENFKTEQVDDQELEERMRPFYDSINQYCNNNTETPEARETTEPKEKRSKTRLSKDAKQLIIDVAQNPESKISERYFRLNLNGKRAQDVVDEIIKSGYAERVDTAIDGAKPARYLILTQESIKWLRSENINVSNLQKIGKTGALHTLYQNILQTYLKKSGHAVWHDYPVGEKFVDVYSEKQNIRTAYEIAISDAVDSKRVASALDRVDEYVFLCKDHVVGNSIRLQLSHIIAQNKNKIRLYTASQYLKNLKKGILDYYTYNNKNTSNKAEQPKTSPDGIEQQKNKRSGEKKRN